MSLKKKKRKSLPSREKIYSTSFSTEVQRSYVKIVPRGRAWGRGYTLTYVLLTIFRRFYGIPCACVDSSPSPQETAAPVYEAKYAITS